MKNRCLNPAHQERSNYSRGLCQCCYASASRLVKKGKITWKELEKRGKSLPLAVKKRGQNIDWLMDEEKEEYQKDDLDGVL